MRLGAVVVVGGLAVIAGPAMLRHLPAKPHGQSSGPVLPTIKQETGRRVIATGQGSRNDRCDVAAAVDGGAGAVATVFEVDTGDPVEADFPGKYIKRLGVDAAALNWYELDPGTRYGKIAHATLRQIRIGEVVWNNPEVRFFSNWRYTFGADEIPLLGLHALNSKGIHVEFDGGGCRLTAAR